MLISWPFSSEPRTLVVSSGVAGKSARTNGPSSTTSTNAQQLPSSFRPAA
ncbi:MAG: hypothetical protein JOZ69_25710 [Myxococcales bacterium]|nr:hypothetical protein [Myxococcales bacterium]